MKLAQASKTIPPAAPGVDVIRQLARIFVIAVALAGFAGWLALLGIPAWQSLVWLKTGFWPSLTVADFCQWAGWYPTSAWGGVEQIISWFLTWPLSCAAPLLSTIVLVPMGPAIEWAFSESRPVDHSPLCTFSANELEEGDDTQD